MTRSIQHFTASAADEAALAAVSQLREMKSSGTAFDSATESFGNELKNTAGMTLPEGFQAMFDSASATERSLILDSVVSGVESYEAQHGSTCPPDVMNQMLHNIGCYFDSASSDSNHSNNLSLNAAQAIVSVGAMMGSSVPFAHYVPTAESSGEAKIALIKHRAGTTTGSYAANDVLNGIDNGEAYMASLRVHTVDAAADGSVAGNITKIQETPFTCKQDAGAVKQRAGKCVVMIGGKPVAKEISNEPSTSNSVAGSFVFEGTNYTLAGSINSETGAFSFTTTPGIEESTPVVVMSEIDYERDADLIPLFSTSATVKSVFASPFRAYSHITLDSLKQMQSELNVNGVQEALACIQTQIANERHKQLLRLAALMARSNTVDFNLQYAAKTANMNVADMLVDMGSHLDAASRTMVENTNDTGITHIYCGKKMAQYFTAMHRADFTPSGLPVRAGIYRLGRYKDQYDVYYVPETAKGKLLNETDTAAEILLIGRSNEVARAGFVMGDNVPVHIETTSKDKTLAEGAACYGKSFNELNPHSETWGSVMMMNITGLPSSADVRAPAPTITES